MHSTLARRQHPHRPCADARSITSTRAARVGACALAALLAACTVVEPPPAVLPTAPAGPAAEPVVLAPSAVVSIYEEVPLFQPLPVLVPWAPPPLLVQVPPPPPYDDAFWVGGYWGWQGRWVWSAGYWARPPRPGYVWIEPYYEHRGSGVVFISGFWGAPGVVFAPPAPSLRLSLSLTLGGAMGVPPIGPQGVFIPAPPGSRAGLIVPAPVGTPPAVLTGAPPVVQGGMHVINSNNTTINQNITINRIANVRSVTVVAPPSATRDAQAFRAEVPARPALAAAMPAQTHWQAPLPQSRERLQPMGEAGRSPVALPAPQPVRVVPAAPMTRERTVEPATPAATAAPASPERAVEPRARVEAAPELARPAPAREPAAQTPPPAAARGVEGQQPAERHPPAATTREAAPREVPSKEAPPKAVAHEEEAPRREPQHAAQPPRPTHSPRPPATRAEPPKQAAHPSVPHTPQAKPAERQPAQRHAPPAERKERQE